MKKENKKKRVTIHLYEFHIEKIKELAFRKDCSIGYIVRDMCNKYLNEKNEKRN
ncbi:MAG: hypothetical protein IT243_05990 [Bacteroidia bacterium]|nr:hypothetical protein [Bacteroidia bacterium]